MPFSTRPNLKDNRRLGDLVTHIGRNKVSAEEMGYLDDADRHESLIAEVMNTWKLLDGCSRKCLFDLLHVLLLLF